MPGLCLSGAEALELVSPRLQARDFHGRCEPHILNSHKCLERQQSRRELFSLCCDVLVVNEPLCLVERKEAQPRATSSDEEGY